MRRVLLVTYDFPPVGGSGVQRISKFAKYLPRFGWQPIVLTSRRGRMGPQDRTLLADLGEPEIHRTIAPDPYRWLASLGRRLSDRPASHPRGLHGNRLGPWHPAAWLVPDGKLPWLPFGVHWALKHRARACDAVVSTVPTPTAAILGSLISRAWRVPHIIDYRDPWTGGFYLPRRFSLLQHLEAAWERRILTGAAAACVVPGVLESLPDVDTPIRLIHNGYDETDFDEVTPTRADGDFVIAHVGILWRERDLAPLIGACGLLRDQLPEVAARLHFIQIGRIDRHVATQIQQLGATVRASAHPSVSHREAIGRMLAADLLYLPTSHDHVPGKTYEYLRSDTPILALGGRHSHLAKLLDETGGGLVVNHSDQQAIAHLIAGSVNGARPFPPVNQARLTQFSREAAARALASLLDDVGRAR
ncbi:MAG: hypothetical protein JSU87_03440 [Gemmatimonadota bacterium]|nr:MAG: hypothetical protein JSU87_03440 [Gemmatimonadota bacterium]